MNALAAAAQKQRSTRSGVQLSVLERLRGMGIRAEGEASSHDRVLRCDVALETGDVRRQLAAGFGDRVWRLQQRLRQQKKTEFPGVEYGRQTSGVCGDSDFSDGTAGRGTQECWVEVYDSTDRDDGWRAVARNSGVGKLAEVRNTVRDRYDTNSGYPAGSQGHAARPRVQRMAVEIDGPGHFCATSRLDSLGRVPTGKWQD